MTAFGSEQTTRI